MRLLLEFLYGPSTNCEIAFSRISDLFASFLSVPITLTPLVGSYIEGDFLFGPSNETAKGAKFLLR